MSKLAFASVEEVLNELGQGRMVILVDDEDRENEGDLIMAAEKVTPEAINFMTRYGRGLVCAPLAASYLKRLNIPMMVEQNRSKYETAFSVSVGAANGITTGISAADRAHTIKILVNPESESKDIVSPGHVFPLCAREGGVLVRTGHTEGATDLASLAGLQPAGVLCEIMNDDGSMARLPELQRFAAEHQLKIISINDIIAYRMQRECLVEKVAQSRLPLTPHGEFTIKIFKDTINKIEHVVLQKGEISQDKPCLVRVHSECLTGDTFGSSRCDCGWQLESSLNAIAQEGGVLLYMYQEGRGIGLANKIKAYALQDEGMDTVEANHHLGFNADHRDYGIGSQILRYLGIRKMILMTNNPRKCYGIEGYDLEIVDRRPIEMIPTTENIHYLRTKRDKLGHILTKIDVEDAT